MKLYGIAGSAGSGKTTVARYIADKHKCKLIAFADPIKEMLAAGLDLSHEQLHGDCKDTIDKRYGKSPRYMMQSLGTEWGRGMVNFDIWVNVTRARINGDTVIHDVRYDNEARMIRRLGGTIIHVAGKARKYNHSSEDGIMMRPNDQFIRNVGSLEDLYKVVEEII